MIALVFVGCDITELLSGEAGSVIRKAVRDNGAKEIDLATVIPFSWDELYLFTPYTPTSHVCKELSIPKNKCTAIVAQESVDDGEMYMVFKFNGDIVHKEMHIRSNGDFTPIDYPMPIRLEQAKFKVVNDGEISASGAPWFRLVPAHQL